MLLATANPTSKIFRAAPVTLTRARGRASPFDGTKQEKCPSSRTSQGNQDSQKNLVDPACCQQGARAAVRSKGSRRRRGYAGTKWI